MFSFIGLQFMSGYDEAPEVGISRSNKPNIFCLNTADFRIRRS